MDIGEIQETFTIEPAVDPFKVPVEEPAPKPVEAPVEKPAKVPVPA